MEAAVATKAEEPKTGHAPPVTTPEVQLSPREKLGTPAGMPLFLQRFAFLDAPILVQRQEKAEEPEEQEEEEPIQTKLDADSTFIQRQEEEPEEEEPVQAKLTSASPAFVQRQEEESEKQEEEEPVQAKLTAGPTFIQRQEEEPEEQEEEESVQAKPTSASPAFVQRQEEESEKQEEEEPVQAKLTAGPTFIQRQEEEPEEQEEEESVQAKPTSASPAFVQHQEEEPEEEEEKPVQAKLTAGPTFIQCQEEEPEEEPEEPIQTKLAIGRAGDAYEREADTVASRVTAGLPSPPISRVSPGSLGGVGQRQIESAASPALSSQLASSQAAGLPLPTEIRAQMESHFGAGFGHVRVHTDHSAHQLNQGLRSQAFTHGNHIYFGAGRYNPRTGAGKRLIAHELTHVVQQGATARQSTPKTIQRMTWGDIGSTIADLVVGGVVSLITGGLDAVKRTFLRHLRNFAHRVPGYRLLTVVLGRDPITDVDVARNGRNFIEAGLDVIPGGALLKRKLEQEGALSEAAAWLDEQLELLDFRPADILAEFGRFWSGLGLSDLGSPIAVLRRIQGIFQPPIARLFRFARNVAARLLQIVKDYLVSQAISFIRERTRAYPLVRLLLGQDPISGESVQRTPMNLLRAFMELSEDGAEKLRQMERTGTLQRVANWINSAAARLTRNVRAIRSGFTRIWRSVTIQSLMDPIGTFEEIYSTFAGPVGDILSFLIEVGAQVLRFIKNALLSRLSAYARTVRGYHLLTVILGQDPFTGEEVPRTAHNFIRGFLSLLSDGEERYRNLQESGAIDRAFQWLNGEVERLDLSWAAIRELFQTAWESLSIRDLANPIGAFRRIVNLFRAPVGRIIRFAGAVGLKILEFVFEGIMGAGGARVLAILRRAGETFMTIVRDPVGFLSNLLRAVVQGFQQFATNILQHLASGLVGWLFGALEGAGLQLPERFDLRGIISLVLQILGLTYARIRTRLVRLLGERAVSILERTFEFLRVLVTEGPAGAWQRIVEYAGNLRDQVMELKSVLALQQAGAREAPIWEQDRVLAAIEDDEGLRAEG